jgi:hypothetical protein
MKLFPSFSECLLGPVFGFRLAFLLSNLPITYTKVNIHINEPNNRLCENLHPLHIHLRTLHMPQHSTIKNTTG